MKKLLIAAVANTALGCSLAPISAMAQSSVTLYGLIDEGLNYTSNTGGHSNIQMESGFAQGSRWGLRGRRIWAAAPRLSSSWKTDSTSTRASSGKVGGCSAVRPTSA
jgi:hypothetical protein